MRQLVARVGDGGALVTMQSIDEAIDYLNQAEVGKPTSWTSDGFETPNFHGDDRVMLYWQSPDRQLVSLILYDERIVLEDALHEVFA